MADTPQDSGEPLGEDTGSVAGSLDNLPESSMTSDTGETTAEYDQAILFIHGIGDQKPGDTFKAMVNPLKKEWEKDGLKIEALNNKSKKGQVGKKSPLVESDIQLSGAYSKKVALREVYWHGGENDFSTTSSKRKFRNRLKKIKLMQKAARKKYLKYISNKFLSCSVDNILIILGVIQIFFLKLLQFRPSTIALILVSAFLLSDFSSVNKISQDDGHEDSIVAVYNAIRPFISLLFGLWVVFVIFYNSAMIGKLYGQIKACSAGSDSAKIDRVSSNIMNILNKSKNVLIVAHSMGGYLSYEALSRQSTVKYLESNSSKRVSLCGLGSGLGPMLVIKKYKESYLVTKIIFPVILVFAFFLYATSWINLWYNLIILFYNPSLGSRFYYLQNWKFKPEKKISIDFCHFNFSYDLTLISSAYMVIFCIAMLVICRIFVLILNFIYYNPRVPNFNSLNTSSHREFYYVSDIVGNTSRFAYSNKVGQEMLGNPIFSDKNGENTHLGKFLLEVVYRRFIYSHNMEYYFKSDRLNKFLKDCSLSGNDPKVFLSKDYSSWWLWGIYCLAQVVGTFLFYVILEDSNRNESSLVWIAVVYFPLIIFYSWLLYCGGYILYNLIKMLELRFYRRYPSLVGAGTLNDMTVATAIDKNNFPVYGFFQFIVVSLIPPFATLFSSTIFDFFNYLIKFTLFIFASLILFYFVKKIFLVKFKNRK